MPNVQSIFGFIWCRSAKQIHNTFFCSGLLLLSHLPKPVPSCAWLRSSNTHTHRSPAVSVPILLQSLLFPKTLLCTCIFTRLCHHTVYLPCSPHCSFHPVFPCLVPVTWGARSAVSLATNNNHLINYTLQGRGRKHKYGPDEQLDHWSLGLQELIRWSQIKPATTAPPWPPCTGGGHGNCSVRERGK